MAIAREPGPPGRSEDETKAALSVEMDRWLAEHPAETGKWLQAWRARRLWLARERRRGNAVADVHDVLSSDGFIDEEIDGGTLRTRPRNEDDRMGAARRLADSIPKPIIHPGRWPAVLESLREHGAAHGKTAEQEFDSFMLSAMFTAVLALEKLPDHGGEGIPSLLRRELNRAVTEDLLDGREWRRGSAAGRGEALDPDTLPGDSRQAEIEARLAVHSVIRCAGLTRREADLIVALAKEGTLTGAARVLGIKDGTAWALSHRARKKISGIAKNL